MGVTPPPPRPGPRPPLSRGALGGPPPNRQAAQSTADPCLKELYQELAQEGAFHAGTIRSLLEQMG